MMLAWGMMAALWRGAAFRAGTGRRRGHDRRRRAADGDALRRQGDRAVEQPARRQPARRRRVFYGPMPAPTASSWRLAHRAAVLPRTAASCWASMTPRCTAATTPRNGRRCGRLAAIFVTRTRDEWCALLEGADACVAPVLEMDEAPDHPHNRARDTFLTIDDVVQPAPAPRLSRTPAAVQGRAAAARPGYRRGARRLGIYTRGDCRVARCGRHRVRSSKFNVSQSPGGNQ
jgi:hypothetical protein